MVPTISKFEIWERLDPRYFERVIAQLRPEWPSESAHFSNYELFELIEDDLSIEDFQTIWQNQVLRYDAEKTVLDIAKLTD